MSETTNVLKVRGFIHTIYPVKKWDSGFYKRDFDLETRETGKDGKTYRNVDTFTALKSFSAILDKLGIGSEVDVYYQLNGRIWEKPETGEKKTISSNRAWKIDVINNTNQEADKKETANEYADVDPIDDSSDLPF